MQDTERRQLLKDEYLHIQKTVVELDGRAITIKAWTVSFSGTDWSLRCAQSRHLFCVGIQCTFVFFIEGYWKHNQQAFYFRSELIERYFAGQLQDEQLEPFQIDRHWVQFDRGRQRLDYLKAMLRPHVYLPHAPICALGVALYVLARLGYIQV